jgi:hypothetical protein
MDKIYEAAAKYVALSNYEYEFVLSQNRRCRKIKISFHDEDFYHLAGLQYVREIDIPRNRKKTLDDIVIKHKITDDILMKSSSYQNPLPDKDIKSRIDLLRFLEEYIDTDNIIRIFNTRNSAKLSSQINADYIIESQLKGDPNVVYIFLKHRIEEPDYCCVVSFFKKGNAVYGGDILYWMRKTKILGDEVKVLYQHKDFKG